MPRNPNRRTIEVSADVYDHLRVRAEERGDTIAGVVRMLIIDGTTVEDWHTAHDAHIRDVQDRLRDLAADVRDLAARVPAVATPAPGGDPEPPTPPRRQRPPRHERDRAADAPDLPAPVAAIAASVPGGDPEPPTTPGRKRRPRWDRERKERARMEHTPTLFDDAATAPERNTP